MGLQIKRGTNANRLLIKLEAGEPFLVTDYSVAGVQPLWIGDGYTYGGIAATHPNHYLSDLLDVLISSPSEGHTLVFSSGRWINAPNNFSPTVYSLKFRLQTTPPSDLTNGIVYLADGVSWDPVNFRSGPYLVSRINGAWVKL